VESERSLNQAPLPPVSAGKLNQLGPTLVPWSKTVPETKKRPGQGSEIPSKPGRSYKRGVRDLNPWDRLSQPCVDTRLFVESVVLPGGWPSPRVPSIPLEFAESSPVLEKYWRRKSGSTVLPQCRWSAGWRKGGRFAPLV
jgi:hypothetical protein